MTVARDAFLGAMRRVASSVTIVTTDGDAGRHGATVSAFCSVSADPPSVLVCLKADSRIARSVAENGSFCVNVLKDSAGDLARRFATYGANAPVDRFAGVDVVTAPGRSAVLAAATSAFSCRLIELHAAGSHLIAIGQVDEVQVGAEPPLAYLDGRYACVSCDRPSTPT